MPNETPKLSYQELLEQLKDPALLQAAALKSGFELTKPKEQSAAPKKREIPKFEIPTAKEDGSDVTMADIATALQKGMNDMMQYMNGTVEDRVGSVKAELNEAKQSDVRAKVQKFAKEHKDFEELIPFIEPFFNAGRDIEEAYTLGRRAAGKTDKPAPTTAPANSPSVKSDEGLDPNAIEGARKPLNVRDAAKKNLNALLEKDPTALETPEE